MTDEHVYMLPLAVERAVDLWGAFIRLLFVGDAFNLIEDFYLQGNDSCYNMIKGYM